MMPLLSEIKQKGYIGKRRVAGFLLAVGMPLLTVTLLGLVSFPGELVSLFGIHFYTFLWAALIALIVLIVALVFVLIARTRKVKPEDKPLFAQLKSAGYSSWSFCPKDKRKFLFIPLFSVVFLEIALLVVQLIERAV